MSIDTPAPPPPRTPPAPRRGRARIVAWSLGGLLACMLVGLALMAAVAWHLLRTESGSRRLLAHLPFVATTGSRGALWGDFDAERVVVTLPGDGGTVTLQGLGWRGLAFSRTAASGVWLRVAIADLHATRVELALKPKPGPGEPMKPPTDLHLPVEVDLASLAVGEVDLGTPGAVPLRDVRARVHLGDDGGALHRIDGLHVGYTPVVADGALSIAAAAPFAVDAKVEVALAATAAASLPATSATAAASAPAASASSSSPVTPAAPPASSPTTPRELRASASLTGPLAQPRLTATLRARADASQPEQTVDARATLAPFAAWPLAALQASTRSLDLSALVAGAPSTSLTGDATVTSTGADQPIAVQATFANERAGAWSASRVPVRRIGVTLRMLADDPDHLTLQAVDVDLGTQSAAAGRVTGHGAWSADSWTLDAALQAVVPATLDARAPAMTLSGPVALKGRGFGAAGSTSAPGPAGSDAGQPAAGRQATEPDGGTIDLSADIAGRLADGGPVRDATLRVSASLNARRIDVREFSARAGAASATLAGTATQAAADAPWVVKARAALADFDPTPWWPGAPGSAWRRGPHRLNATADVDLSAPLAGSGSGSNSRSTSNAGTPTVWQQLAALRGRADLKLANSMLAGVPIGADIALRAADGRSIAARATIEAAGNRVAADGSLGTSASGSDDRWTLTLDAPTLATLAPIWRLAGAGAPGDFGGAAQAKAGVTGRWPSITTQGQLDASDLRAGAASVQHAAATWQFALVPNGVTRLDATLTQAAWTDPHPAPGDAARRVLESVQATIDGTTRAHTVAIDASTGALPPAWTDALMTRLPAAAEALAAPSAGAASTSIARPVTAPTAGATPRPSPAAAIPASTRPAPATSASTAPVSTSPDSTAQASTASGTSPTAAAKATPRTTALPGARDTAPAIAARTAPVRSVAVLRAEGGFVDAGPAPRAASSADGAGATPLQFAGWRGTVRQVELHPSTAPDMPWLRIRDLGVDARWADAASVTVQPGRAEVLGGAVRWSTLAWRAASPGQAARIDVDAELEPLRVSPLLARAQPGFGWGGDLAIAGHVRLHSAPTFTADVVLERRGGDLSVTDDLGTQPLGLTDLRLALDARDGTWNVTQALAGSALGTTAGAIVIRTAPEALMPGPDAPISGTLELRVANLGTWGNWVPAGWRLGGALHASARIDGRFGAPEYTGQVVGSGLAARNFLQGIDVTDGDLQVTLKGTSAHVDRFTAKAGTGTLTLAGDAAFGDAPAATLKLTADHFQLLGRVDRKVAVSGSSDIRVRRDAIEVTGGFGIDEGIVDFTRSDAPTLGDDVTVVRRSTIGPSAIPPATPDDLPVPPATAPTATARALKLDLRIDLGQKLHLKGRGIDTDLRGDLRITSPGGKVSVVGIIRTFGGTYAAYRQKLTIDRGTITFAGAVDNPQLDIQATRSDTDVKVGVVVTGSAVDLRVRLYSDPEVSDMDKLSWLVLGRASDGLGSTDTALLQQAALAVLAGDGPSKTDEFTKAIGLDDIGLKQSDDGTSKSTVLALGKQISRRWYVGYQKGLSATAGSFQLVYRLAQRLTVRAQSGSDNSLDVIWTLRWN